MCVCSCVCVFMTQLVVIIIVCYLPNIMLAYSCVCRPHPALHKQPSTKQQQRTRKHRPVQLLQVHCISTYVHSLSLTLSATYTILIAKPITMHIVIEPR